MASVRQQKDVGAKVDAQHDRNAARGREKEIQNRKHNDRPPNPENPRTIPAAKAVGAISHKNSADVSTMNWVCGAQAFLADGRRVGVRVSTGIRLRQ
jgi:hypothetical protein